MDKVNKEKTLVKLMFPLIEDQDTVYDAQTALGALSGFVKAQLDQKISKILIQDLDIDLSKEKDSKIKSAIVLLIEQLGPENARDTAELLYRFSNILATHSASVYMKKNPMNMIKLTDIVAD